MNKTVLILLALAGALTAQADEYPYLTFETADGSKTSVSSTALTITIKDGMLTAGTKSFSLADLSKMYFSTSDETMGIENLFDSQSGNAEIYDLNGRKVATGTLEELKLPRGVYVIKTKTGTRKVNVK